MFLVSSIVEGHGEVQAVPVLLRRLRSILAPHLPLKVNPPPRVRRDRFIRDSTEFARYVELAARKAQPAGGVLILLDAEDDCPAILGPELLKRARSVRSDVRLAVVLAQREFETWFLAAAESLAGKAGLPQPLQPPPHPEERRGAKEWLAARLPHRKYIEPKHQPTFAECFDIEQARSTASFERLYREVAALFAIPLTVPQPNAAKCP